MEHGRIVKNFVLIAFFLPWSVFAQGSIFRSQSIVQINREDTIRGNLLVTGRIIDLRGQTDDFFAASEQIRIDGMVTDDAFIAARNLNLNGTVHDMLMSASETITIDGLVEGDMFIAAREVRITSNAEIKGNVGIVAQNIYLEGGNIGGWFFGAGANMQLDGKVNKYARLYAGEITFGSNYVAGQGTTLKLEEEIDRGQLGNPPQNLDIIVEKDSFWEIVLFQLWLFFSLLVTGWVLLLLFQATADEMQRLAAQGIWRHTGIGAIAFIVIPVVIIILFVLLVTIPLGILLSLTYGLILFISYLLVALVLGNQIIRFFREEVTIPAHYAALVLGMIVIAILTNIPFVGGLFNILFILFGLGSIIYNFWTKRQAKTTTVENG